jgi:hypothetical protein
MKLAFWKDFDNSFEMDGQLSQNDRKQIGKTASILKLNYYSEEEIKEKSQQVINYLEAKI